MSEPVKVVEGDKVSWICSLGYPYKGTVEIVDGELLRVKLSNGSGRWVRRTDVRRINDSAKHAAEG